MSEWIFTAMAMWYRHTTSTMAMSKTTELSMCFGATSKDGVQPNNYDLRHPIEEKKRRRTTSKKHRFTILMLRC
eukprot:12003198-Heterocapsa_arctica.AAC.1